MRAWLIILLLCGCATTSTPGPADCRWAGVDVADGDPITGAVVTEYYAWDGGVTPDMVHQKCNGAPNCFRAEGFKNLVTVTPKGQYEIWVSQPGMETHERCHALYEETRHSRLR